VVTRALEESSDRLDLDPHTDAPSENADSHVRARSLDGAARGSRRVAEYLRALGLRDNARVEALAHEFAEQADSPEGAVEVAQQRFDEFRNAVFGAESDNVDPLWLRTFIGAFPDSFLGDVVAARRDAASMGDPRAFRPSLHAQFQEQKLQRIRMPGWAIGLGLSGTATLIATTALVRGLAANGLSPLEVLWAVLFASLFALAGIGFTIAVVGFGLTLFARQKTPAQSDDDHVLPRSALVMPIYEEDPEHVFAGIAAMRESLSATPGGEAFEIFILSDSRRPEQVAEEERAFRRVASLPLPLANIPVFYRRRALNERQKAGNLGEFFERFGNRYQYAVVLDADSLMRGDTLVTLLRRMEASPNLALLQAPLQLHAGTTLFARAQQMAASVCGPLFTRGLGYLAGRHGNYYGHNAVIRVQAFLDCCSLPVLAGQPPFGGHILSHDFVEAALLCRAGWDVRMADDLDGSWEELPATLPDYVARDRRWCQGNLQHLRVAMAEGFKPMSRLHMWVGVGSYLAGPTWLCFTVLGAVLAATSGKPIVPASVALPITLATAVMLIGPRVMGVWATLRDRKARAAHGGVVRVILSGLVEIALGSLLAPLLMVHHMRIVMSIVTGSAVRWGAQNRRAQGQFGRLARAEWPSTLLGIGSAALLLWAAPHLVYWLAPIWMPLALSIPIAAFASSSAVGRFLAKLGILSVPSETQPDDLLTRASDLQALTSADETARFRDMVLDPLLLAAQLRKLAGRQNVTPIDPTELARALKRALRSGPAALSPTERDALSQDPESLRALHREAWRSWPVESWQLAREVPQLPSEL
jgi:membrane glycosyltransferase